MTFEQKQRDAELRRKHLEISRLLRQGRAKLSQVLPASQSAPAAEEISRLSPLQPLDSADPEVAPPAPQKTPESEIAAAAVVESEIAAGTESEISESEISSFEASLFAKCPVKGCGEYLNRKIWFSHLVTYHSCRVSAYLKDMRMAKERSVRASLQTADVKLCGLRCDREDERRLYGSLNFAAETRSAGRRATTTEHFARLEDAENFQSHIVAVTNAKERKELRRLLPGPRIAGRAKDVLAMVVVEASEITEDSRFRLAKYVVIIGKALRLSGEEAQIKSLTDFADQVESVNRKLLEEETVRALKIDKKYPLTDTELPGDVVDNGTKTIEATARFAARFIRNIRRTLVCSCFVHKG